MATNHPQYRSYLLRLWQESPGEEWRAVLEDVLTHERKGFASLEALFAFLQARTDRAECRNQSPVASNQ